MPQAPSPHKDLLKYADALAILGSEARLRRLIRQKKIKKITPPGSRYGYYSRADVMVHANAEASFLEAAIAELHLSSGEMSFEVAGPDDVPDILDLSRRIFGSRVAPLDVRLSLMQAECRGMRAPRGAYVVRAADRSIMAFAYLLALREPAISSYLTVGHSWTILSSDVMPIEPGAPLDLVIDGVGVDPGLSADARAHCVALLIRGILQDLTRLGAQGVAIKRVCAFSTTNEGIALCARLGMQQYAPPLGKRCMFCLDLGNVGRHSLFRGYLQALDEYWRREE